MKSLKKNKPRKKLLLQKRFPLLLIVLTVLLLGLFGIVIFMQQKQNLRSSAAPTANLQTDRTNLSFTANGYTSEYHLYAAGLDWTKPVGLIMYTDGSGENGLNNPTSDYLMAGATGMIAVAKKHNMVLVTPFSPNKACSDGDGSCWYDGDPPGYAKWAEALVASIESQYGIDKRRVAIGGYSSGATFTTGWFVPSGAAQRLMDDGVIVAISYGGPAYMDEVAYTPSFKTNVHMSWNVGDQDGSLSDVKEGYNHYTQLGFQTTLDILPGVTHDRSGQFGPIMDVQITKYVIPATGTVPTGSVNPTNKVSPTYGCVGTANCVPSISPTQSNPPLVSPAPPVTIEPSSEPNTSPSTIPSGGELNPYPVISPVSPQNPSNQNFIGQFIAFILYLFTLLLSMFK